MKSLDFGLRTLDCAVLVFFIIVMALPSCATLNALVLRGSIGEPVILAEAVTADTTLSGRVTVAEDLLVPENVTLTFLPGTEVTVIPSDGTRTDSQFVTTETEIVVRGSLVLDSTTIGTRSGSRGSWGGIIVSTPGANVTIRNSLVEGAQYGLAMLGGTAHVSGTEFVNNEIGIAAALGAWLELADNIYRGNAMATAAWHTVTPIMSGTDTFEDNLDDALALAFKPADVLYRETLPVIPDVAKTTREYLGEVALTEDTTWSGTVVIDGQVAVMPEATLTIEPGTRVLFTMRDTNLDGLGESWMIVQGTVKVLGEEDSWVLFDAQDPDAGPGAWDSLSIIASDSKENIVRYSLFRHGVKAFHSHFSRARLDHVIFEDNLRGIQFQESEGTQINWAYLTRNQSGARFRDSRVTMSNVVARDNVAGINFLRSEVTASDLVITGSLAESLVSRESVTTIDRAVFTGNVRGPRFKGEGEKIILRENAIVGNLTEGVSFKHVRGEVRESTLSGNGFTGLSVTDAEVRVHGSRIADNGRFAVDNNGSTVVDARGNDWGFRSLPDSKLIYDSADENGIGRVLVSEPTMFKPLFPGMTLPHGDLEGELLIVGDVSTPGDRALKLLPGTFVHFSEVPVDSLFDLCSDHPSFPSSELLVRGTLEAHGTRDLPVTFAPARRTVFELGPDDLPGRAQWGAVNLNGGKGAVFTNSYFFRAATGIHAREAGKVIVKDSVFTSNDVGLRFSRSDVKISGNVFELNDTGIRFHENGGSVSGNLFDSNGTGIFVTGNPENVTVSDNIFRDNRNYHVKLGIHVTEDVKVQGGKFEVPEGKTIDDMLFDKVDDKDLGRVILIP